MVIRSLISSTMTSFAAVSNSYFPSLLPEGVSSEGVLPGSPKKSPSLPFFPGYKNRLKQQGKPSHPRTQAPANIRGRFSKETPGLMGFYNKFHLFKNVQNRQTGNPSGPPQDAVTTPPSGRREGGQGSPAASGGGVGAGLALLPQRHLEDSHRLLTPY